MKPEARTNRNGALALSLLVMALNAVAQGNPPPTPPSAPTLPPPLPPPLSKQMLLGPNSTTKPTLPAARANALAQDALSVGTIKPPPPVLVAPAVPAVPPAPQVIPQPFAAPANSTPPTALVFDSEFKELTSTYGASNIHVIYWVTNVHTSEVVISAVRPSCGCTIAKMPETPWKLAPKDSGPIEAVLDLRGKFGTLTKSLTVESTSGAKSLLFKVTVPDQNNAVAMSDPDRLKNMQLMLADRQIVFKDAKCAECHADKGQAKMGHELYQADCAICHDSKNRATMVPDLRALKHPTGPAHWKTWITYGRVGSLMPAFAKSQGGPLTDEQIDSLVSYLTQTIPSAPAPTSASLAPIGGK